MDFEWEERDLIVLSQTCDLVKGREKLTEVLLSSVWSRSELTTGHLATPRGMEDARRGNLPGFHVLAECSLAGLQREVRVVDFRRVYSLPVAKRYGTRYRELVEVRARRNVKQQTDEFGTDWFLTVAICVSLFQHQFRNALDGQPGLLCNPHAVRRSQRPEGRVVSQPEWDSHFGNQML